MKVNSETIRAVVTFGLMLLIFPRSPLAQGFKTTFKGYSFTAYKVDLEHDKLELLSQDPSGTRIKNAAYLESLATKTGRRLKFATNSGIFGAAFYPLGLHVENGRQIVSLNTQDGSGNFYMKPNGVFFTKGTRAYVVPTSAFNEGAAVENASQSGPLLLDDGSINPLFNPQSANRLVRSGVGVEGQSKIFFAISDEPVNFHDLASFFRDQLKCRSALYLDGVISVMYAEDLGRKQTTGDFAAMFAVFETVKTN